MSKAKVYLAKSNQANPNVVSDVRQTLSDYDVDIVEYTGGAFSHKAMLDCDFLVVVPVLCESWSEDGVTVGKGLYEQLTVWEDNKTSDGVSIILDEDLLVGEIHDINVIDSTDYIEYGIIEFNPRNADDFEDVLSDFGLIKKAKSSTYVSSNSDSEYYVLIGKKA
jgi:hypothetical protein